MDAVSRSHDVNSSAMVHPLFETEVTALERRRSDRTAAIKRLRASKAEAERQQLIQGRIDGREWVDDAANYEALKRAGGKRQPLPEPLGSAMGAAAIRSRPARPMHR